MTSDPLQIWAPRPTTLTAVAGDHRIEMIKDEQDWWSPALPLPNDLPAEFDYGFLVDDDTTPLPDPRSRRQPGGVHQRSRTYDHHSYRWNDQGWTGRQLAGGVIYELHIGTFTPDGTLAAAIDKLDHLVDLGIDFVEVMPVNAFNGTHNWGYDGVGWYAVQESYGGPRGYQEFVDACHARGLAVIQDVVYNHLGPSGNYLPRFGPYLDTDSRNTWGETINLDGPGSDEVRRFVIDNALMWLRDYHVDGLRLDAVHALPDTRATHLLSELAGEVDALSAQQRRPLSLIAESDLNDPRMITPREAGGHGLAGQWSDDFHHALYVNLTGDTSGYYADFDSVGALAKVINGGFFHDGSWSSFRGRHHGAPLDTRHTPGWRLVVCSDNHDQIGNRAAGQRLPTWLDRRQLELAGLLTLLGPFTPMIFMGEEWGARTPWQFFTSHPEPELGRIVADGRLQEFARMNWDTATVPDPQDPQTFQRSKLDWSEPAEAEHAERLDFTRTLIRLRRELPDLTDPRFDHGTAVVDGESATLTIRRGAAVILVNFGATPARVPGAIGRRLLTVGEATTTDATAVTLGPHSALLARTP